MKLTAKTLIYAICLLLVSFTHKKEQANIIRFTADGQQMDFHFLSKAEILKTYDNREKLQLKAYQSDDKSGPYFQIEITAEPGKHIQAGTYNYGDKDDFYGTYPLSISYFKAVGDAYFTDGSKVESTIESIGNGKVKGNFAGRLNDNDRVFSKVKITDGSFDFNLK